MDGNFNFGRREKAEELVVEYRQTMKDQSQSIKDWESYAKSLPMEKTAAKLTKLAGMKPMATLDETLEESRDAAESASGSAGKGEKSGALDLSDWKLSGVRSKEKGSGSATGRGGGRGSGRAREKGDDDTAIYGDPRGASTSSGLGGDPRGFRRHDNDSPWGRSRNASDSDHSRQPKIAQILSSSAKVIRQKITRTSDIVAFSDQLERLESSIVDAYPDTHEKLKIQIALNQLDDSIRSEGDSIFETCKENGYYCLNSFLREIFSFSFPSPQTSLNTAFENLTQNHPERTSITDYARRFRSIINKLKYSLDGFKAKFVEGLSNSELKGALRRSNWEVLSFQELVALAVAIEANLTKEKHSSKVLYTGAGDGTREERELQCGGFCGMGGTKEKDKEGEDVLLIMGIPLRRYFETADKHGLANRCFNCFAGSHRVGACIRKNCKFCEKPTSDARHYSLLCPRAPKSFHKFIEARTQAKQQAAKVEKARFAEDYMDYNFDSDSMSE